MPPTILITGAGQLGKALANVYNSADFDYNCIFVDKSELDISDEKQVRTFFKSLPTIRYCINAAAYTNVDVCETNSVENQAVNVDGVANLARACQSIGAYLLHISTDYIFDGSSNQPYTEANSVNPINAYGLAKYQGEQMAFKYCEKAVVVRTSWLYGYAGGNFVKTILKLAMANTTLKVVDDQIGSPTYALDLAGALFSIIKYAECSDENLTGLYHFCNRGIVSRYDFARKICENICFRCKILNPPKPEISRHPAQRPLYSALDTTKIRTTFNLEINTWQKSLRHFSTVYSL